MPGALDAPPQNDCRISKQPDQTAEEHKRTAEAPITANKHPNHRRRKKKRLLLGTSAAAVVIAGARKRKTKTPASILLLAAAAAGAVMTRESLNNRLPLLTK